MKASPRGGWGVREEGAIKNLLQDTYVSVQDMSVAELQLQ